MIQPSLLQNVLFLDIETVPAFASFDQLSDDLKHLWEDKFNMISKRMPEKYNENDTAASTFNQSAGIYAEFGKIVCISVGYVFYENGQMHFRTKSFAHDDEQKLLTDFAALLNKSYNTNDHSICGHNIKEFDVPYICRRMLINRVELPKIIDISGKKPWEINFYDTMELWKFGDFKNYTSLKLLTAVFGIPTPKDDIDGSQVANVYYVENDLARIARYCEKDVVATAQVFLAINRMEQINIEHITHV